MVVMKIDTHSEHIQAGTRGQKLSSMLSAKLPVPNGFIVSSHAFEQFCEYNNLDEKINEILSAPIPTDSKLLQKKSKEIQKHIRYGQFPEHIAHPILAQYIGMKEPRVMLSPSIFLEEKISSLFTSSDRTYFGYQGDANLFDGIRQLWSHFFDIKPLFYRLKHDKSHFDLPFAITIQKQPRFVVTGQLYTTDPTTPAKHTALIKAVWGEGALTDELDGSDYYWISIPSGEEQKKALDKQSHEFFWDNGNATKTLTPATRVQKRKLSQASLEQLAKLAKKVQQHFFFPQEVVFGFDGTEFFVLESKRLEIKPVKQVGVPSVSPEKKLPKKSHVQLPESFPLGLDYTVSPSGHLPTSQKVSGHLVIQTNAILSHFEAQKTIRSRNVCVHQIAQSFHFLSKHIDPAKGFLYAINLDQSQLAVDTEITAFIALKKLHPTISLGVSIAGTHLTHKIHTTMSLLMQAGVVRSSKTRLYPVLQLPSQIWEIESYLQKGIDGIILDIDRMSERLSGDKPQQSCDLSHPIVIELLTKVSQIARENGMPLFVTSTFAPDHDMLESIHKLLIYEWISTEDSYLLSLHAIGNHNT